MNKDKRNNIQLLGTLTNADESGIIANANQIYDDVQQKAQETINSELIAAVGTGGSVDTRITNAVNVEKTRAEGAESTLDGRVDTLEEAVGTGGSVDSRIASAVATETSRAQEAEANRYTKNETYTKEEVNNLITTPNQEYVSVTATDQTTAVTDVLPAIGLADTVYRVGSWDGSQYDVTKYSEYAWNGKDYVHLSTKTGEASAASNVTYNHSDSKLDATNVQQAVDEIYKKSNYNYGNEVIDFNTIHIITDNPEYICVAVDADDRILYGIKANGQPYFGVGCPQQVKDYVEKKIGLSEGDKTLQMLLNEKFDKVNVAQELGYSEEKVVSQFALPFKTVENENSDYLYAIVDATNHFIAGIKKDGSVEWSKGIPTPIKELEAIIEQNKLDIDNKINLGSNIYPANIQSVTENKKYKEVLLDKDNKIIRCINKDNEEEIYLPQNFFGTKTTSSIENDKYLEILYSRNGRILSSRDKNGMLTEYAGLDAPFYLKNGKKIRTLSYEDTIYVAAKDSDDTDKVSADYICDGINDEKEINEAIVTLKRRSGLRYKKVVLFSGHYYIDSFPEVLGDWKSAIAFHSDNGMLGDSLTISGISHYYRSTVIYVTEKALNSIADNTKYSVIMCMPSTKDNSVVRFDVQNIMIALANNQHPIVAVNLQYGDCGECKNIYMTASGLYDNSETGINTGTSVRDKAVEGVIALRSYHGYTIGDTVRFDNICAFGFYTAFQLGCEHAIYNNLRSRFCHTGYTFGEYHTELVRGAFDHPMTLINCCDEQSIQGPVFAWNGLINKELSDKYNVKDRKLQSVTFIDFNYETPIHKAYEVEPGTFCGLILYHPSDGTFGGMPNYSFWKDGSGKNFTTINLTQANGGTSELRKSYGAHYMQHFFDTDLNKETIFNGTNWVDCLGNIV